MKEAHVHEVMKQYGEWAKEENARQKKVYEDSLAAQYYDNP